MYAIIINAVAIIIGSAIGALFQRGISEKYVNVLNTAMGLCAITLGANVAMESMQKSEYPVLFIFCLSIGGLIGTLLKMDQHMDRATRSISGSNLARHHHRHSTLLRRHTRHDGARDERTLRRQHLSHDCRHAQLRHRSGARLVVWFRHSAHWHRCVRMDVVNLRHSTALAVAHLARTHHRSVARRRHTHHRFRLRHTAHQRLQDHQSASCPLHAYFFLRTARPLHPVRHQFLT